MATLAELLAQAAQEAEWERDRELLSQGAPSGLEGVVPTAQGTALGTPFIDPIDIISGGAGGAKFALSTGRAPLAEALRWASLGGDILYDVGRGIGRKVLGRASQSLGRGAETISGARIPTRPGVSRTMGTPTPRERMLPQELLPAGREVPLLRRGHPPGAGVLPSTGRVFEAPASTISHLMPESSLPTALVQPEAQGLTMTVKRMFEALNRPLERVPKGLIQEGKVAFGKGEPDPTDLLNAVRKMMGRKELGKIKVKKELLKDFETEDLALANVVASTYKKYGIKAVHEAKKQFGKDLEDLSLSQILELRVGGRQPRALGADVAKGGRTISTWERTRWVTRKDVEIVRPYWNPSGEVEGYIIRLSNGQEISRPLKQLKGLPK